MRILPIRPNPRRSYQNKVEDLCKLLKDEEGKEYRVSVFRLLGISANTFTKLHLTHFRQCREARLFLREYPADPRALQIMDELDRLYSSPINDVDNLRGAVGEVFSFFICSKQYQNAEIEVQVEIDTWQSGSIDTAGCSKKKGHCLQSKYSMTMKDLASIVSQQSDFDKIEELTSGKAQGFFITYGHKEVFFQSLNAFGMSPTGYKVFDRSDLSVLERRLAS